MHFLRVSRLILGAPLPYFAFWQLSRSSSNKLLYFLVIGSDCYKAINQSLVALEMHNLKLIYAFVHSSLEMLAYWASEYCDETYKSLPFIKN